MGVFTLFCKINYTVQVSCFNMIIITYTLSNFRNDFTKIDHVYVQRAPTRSVHINEIIGCSKCRILRSGIGLSTNVL